MSRPALTLPPLASPVDILWHILLDLSEQLRTPWAVVGGQMVLLHALEHRQVPPQISQDGDVVADVRAAPNAISAIVNALQRAGFAVAGMSPDGLAHRYQRTAVPHPDQDRHTRTRRARAPNRSHDDPAHRNAGRNASPPAHGMGQRDP